MNKRVFKLSHSETYWDGVVEIESENPAAVEEIKQTVEFWSGWEDRLDESNGDYTRAFLKMLGRKLTLMQLHIGYNLMQLHIGYNLRGVIEAMTHEEGWPTLDGTHGIRLTRCDDAEVDEDDIFIEEVTGQ